MHYLIPILFICSMLESYQTYFSNNKKVILQEVHINNNSLKKSNSNVLYYRTQNNTILGVTNTLLVKVKDINYLDEYIEDFNLQILQNLGNNIFLLETSDKALTLDISSKLYNKDDVIYSHPNFIKQSILR